MAQIVGVFRIGRDAEVRFTQNGEPVASLSLVFNYGKKEADGNKPSQWIDASLWGKRAEAMAPYLLKGSMIYATISDPHIETYQGKNGEGHKLVGKVLDIEFAGSKQDTEPAQHRASRQAMDSQRPTGGASGFDDMDSDIPFITASLNYDPILSKLRGNCD